MFDTTAFLAGLFGLDAGPAAAPADRPQDAAPVAGGLDGGQDHGGPGGGDLQAGGCLGPVTEDVDGDLAGWTEYSSADGRHGWRRADVAEQTIIDVPTPCSGCGGIERWQDLTGTWRCPTCSPPGPRAAELRQRVAAARARHPIVKTWPLPGADAVLQLTPDDLPPCWRFGGLDCYDSGRLLNELRIDLLVIGPGGVNHRSGQLRRDVERIVQVARRGGWHPVIRDADAGPKPCWQTPLPPWPPPVPDSILAAPVPMCSGCGTVPVVGGQPGRAAGLCFGCWMRQAATSPKQKLAGLQAHDLQDAKRQAAERFQTIAQDILDAAGVQHIDYHDKGLRGKAWGKQKRVLVPWPTTRRRLYVVAHEAGHVAMGHARTKAHREEYEAEKYAHDALRKHGVAVPAESTRQAKDYVAWKIHQAIRRGAKAIDRQALEWCRDYWTEETKRWLTEQ